MIHYFLNSVTIAPITYYGTLGIALTGMIWSIVIELNSCLRKHILMFPEDQWLVPCSNNRKYNNVFRTIWIVAVIIAAVFSLAITWG